MFYRERDAETEGWIHKGERRAWWGFLVKNYLIVLFAEFHVTLYSISSFCCKFMSDRKSDEAAGNQLEMLGMCSYFKLNVNTNLEF